jgi:hypothetical protein
LSQDSIDLLKVLAATALVFAVSTLVMLYVIWLGALYANNWPVVGSVLPISSPDIGALIVNTRVFVVLAVVHITAMGLALFLTSHTIDMALLITSKAVSVVVTAQLGMAGGQIVFAQLNDAAPINLAALTPALVVLVGYLVLSSILSVQNLRQTGKLRFAIGALLILAAPFILVWF